MFLFVLLAGMSGSMIYAQTVESPVLATQVEIINHPYYYQEGAGTPVPLEKAIAGTKTKKVILGYGGVNFLYEIKGVASPLRITGTNQPEFLINTGGAPVPDLTLYKLTVKKGMRHAVGGAYKTFGGMKTGEGVIPFNVLSAGEGLHRIVPAEELEAGEYFFAGATVEGSASFPVFAFGLDYGSGAANNKSEENNSSTIAVHDNKLITTDSGAGLAYEQGDRTAQIGFGIGGGFYVGDITMPPLQLRFEYGLKEKISIGAVVGYASSSFYYDNYHPYGGTSRASIDYSYLLIAGRGNYHFATSEKFDPYGGISLGYNNISIQDTGGNLGYMEPVTSGLFFGAQLGANYYFTERLGAWAELGYGLGLLNLGGTMKF